MSCKKNDGKGIAIFSPATGQAVALEQVPDPVFSQKIISVLKEVTIPGPTLESS